MTSLAEYRNSRDLSLEAMAVQLGLAPSTKGFLSRLENAEAAFPLRLALQIQVWSGGQVRAIDLVSPEDRALMQAAAAAQEAA